MKSAVIRWTLLPAALFVVGPLLALLNGAMQAADGSHDVTALTGLSIGVGLGILLVQFGVAALLGGLTANLVGVRSGLICAGFTLLAPANANGTLLGLMRWDGTTSALRDLAIEGAVVALLGALTTWFILRAGRRHETEPTEKLASAGSAVALLVAFAAAGAGAWIVARETLSGQTIGAAGVAGLAGATLGRIAAPRASAIMFVVAIGLLAVAGPVIATGASGAEIARDVYELKVVPLARPLPMHWMAGGLIGVPLGMAWAGQMLEKRGARPGA